MFEGKTNAALKLISEEGSIGVLELTEDTKRTLNEKHPPPSETEDGALLYGPNPTPPAPSFFECIDEQQVLKAAQRTKGAGGPSHMDAEQYRHILNSSKYIE